MMPTPPKPKAIALGLRLKNGFQATIQPLLTTYEEEVENIGNELESLIAHAIHWRDTPKIERLHELVVRLEKVFPSIAVGKEDYAEALAKGRYRLLEAKRHKFWDVTTFAQKLYEAKSRQLPREGDKQEYLRMVKNASMEIRNNSRSLTYLLDPSDPNPQRATRLDQREAQIYLNAVTERLSQEAHKKEQKGVVLEGDEA